MNSAGQHGIPQKGPTVYQIHLHRCTPGLPETLARMKVDADLRYLPLQALTLCFAVAQ